MTTARELFKAILDNPKEDAPRLMYADWLDGEKPDPTPAYQAQAEFIRVQIGLVRDSDPATGGKLTPAREAELRVRETVLLAAMIDALGPDIAKVVRARPDYITFDRGIINNLDLSNTPITALPDDLQVGGSLSLHHTPIRALPEGLKVGGSLDLNDTPITRLPAGLQVGGSLYLEEARITALPINLQSGGGLFLSFSQITRLPAGLQVVGSLYLNDTPISALPNGLKVGGNLDLEYTRIKTLPDDLQVEGNLGLYNTKLTREAILRIPDMPGLSATAKITGLRTAGFGALADQVERDSARPHGGRQ